MSRHAYLIMVHHRPDLLRELLSAIDDYRNDIYIHIDCKSNVTDWDLETHASRVVCVEPMSVNWAGYTQIECTYKLLSAAYEQGPYEYYHFVTGVTFPLKSQDEIHSFFDQNQGTEFIGFDDKNDFSFRAKYFFAFSEMGKPSDFISKVKWKIRELLIKMQSAVKFNRLIFDKELRSWVIKKGMAYVSITHDFVGYVLQSRGKIQKLLKHSISGDEIFIQTLAYNSPYRAKLYSLENEFLGCSREFAWDDVMGEREGHNYIWDDLEFLLRSDKCFALKFEGKDGMRLIHEIKEKKNIK